MLRKLILLLPLLLLTACNRPLDSARAEAIINRDLRVPPRITIFMPYGVSTRTSPGQHCDDPIFEPFGVSDVRNRGLDTAGLVTVTELKPCGDVDIEFTPLAARDVLPVPAPAGDSNHYALLSLADYKGYEVTSIVEQGTHALAKLAVHFTLTPSGKAYADAGGQSEQPNCAIAINEVICTSDYKLLRNGHTWQSVSPDLLQ